MTVYRKIDSISDIAKAVFVRYEGSANGSIECVRDVIGCDCTVLADNDSAVMRMMNGDDDILFVCTGSDNTASKGLELCHTLRDGGFDGIIVLVIDNDIDFSSTADITSEGFDNYILSSDTKQRIADTVKWAILNRKRRNKYSIQFDNSPDMFFTIDKKGKVFDINLAATESRNIKPREVVKKGVSVSELETLRCFEKIIQPMITEGNIGKVFAQTVEEGEAVFQIKTSVHNIPTMGLVATVVKSDITKTTYSRTLDILANSVTMLSQRDNYTAAHSARVFYYCTHIAGGLGLTQNRKFMKELCFAALLHDIGKIGIKDNILLKPGKLTGKEYSELVTHTVKGYKMLQPYKFLGDCPELVHSHHERPDGKGYPDKIKGSKLSTGAAIIAVADGFDAMTSNRPYRKSLSLEKAISEIRDNLGTQFSREAGEVLVSSVSDSLVKDIKHASQRPLGLISREVVDTILR